MATITGTTTTQPALTLRARRALRRRLTAAEPVSELYRRLRAAS